MIQDDDLISLFLITPASSSDEYDETIVSPESEAMVWALLSYNGLGLEGAECVCHRPKIKLIQAEGTLAHSISLSQL
jgi:hypothetical protein